MTVHLSLGMWLVPLATSLVLLTWALIPRPDERQSSDYDFTFWLPGAFRIAAAIIASLVAWLIWSLAR